MTSKIEDEELVINLRDVFKAIGKNILAILLTATITGIVLLAATVFWIKPSYKAEASLYVNNSSFSFGQTSFSISTSELTASATLSKAYIYILKTRETLEEVIRRFNLDYSYEQLLKMISTEEIPGTAIFKVTVSSKNPVEAEKIANGIVEILPERIEEIIDGSTVRTVSYAIIPSHRAIPFWVWPLIGFILGFMLACVVVCIRDINGGHEIVMIGTSSDLKKRYPDITVLSVIPDMRLSDKKGYYYSSYYGSAKKGVK